MQEGRRRNMTDSAQALQLRIQSRYDKRYWLDVAVSPETTLTELDHFLRNIWLECCGHLSEFSTSGRPVRVLRPSLKVSEAFGRSKSIDYVYDFGSSTQLVIKRGKSVPAQGKGVTLLTRNEPLEHRCNECDLPAVAICLECSLEEDSLFCEEHEQSHECGEESLMPVVNSPRMGVCGYGG
jgi:hypothetical protein